MRIGAAGRASLSMNPLFVNVIHRVDPAPARLESLRFQQDSAHRHGLRTTVLLTYGALIDPTSIAYAREQRDRHGDELGLHLHELMVPEFRQRFRTDEKAFWLLPRQTQRDVLDLLIARFTEAFGAAPSAVGSYILDADTLNDLRERHPSVKAAIVNCFEEGVRMYQGNNQEWYLFSDGGPWGAYHPSKACHLVPARDTEEWCGIVGLPHLNRDMVLSLTSRDDLFSSHPANLIRACANEGDRCDYVLHFIDQWIEQGRHNSHGYYSLFVSPPWITAGHPFVDDPQDARRLYDESLAYLRDRQDAGQVRCVTMTEFARWFAGNVKPGESTVNLSRDLMCDAGREMFWYVDHAFRVAIDLNLGGAICDLRPYDGRIDRNLGPETPSLWNGNYPFLISTALRGGYRTGPIHSCEVHHAGRSVSLAEARSRGAIERAPDGTAVLQIEPVTVEVAGLRVTVASTYRFPGDGTIAIERRVVSLSDPTATVELREYHRGCWGTTEYPEDLRGLTLRTRDATADVQELSYAYASRRIATTTPAEVSAGIPPLGCQVALQPVNGAERGEALEGHMFRPFYTLALARCVTAGQSFITRLQFRPL